MRPAAPDSARAGLSLVMMIVAIAVLLVAMVSGVLVAMSATGGEDAEAAGEQQAAAEEAAPEKGWVEFGSAVANLNEVRMTRYLKVTIVLEVPVEDVPKVQEIMAGGQKAVYQDWITEYLSDLSLEEVRGAPQIQALRRDIQSGFRSIMKEYNPQVDPQEVDVLFTEYNVQ